MLNINIKFFKAKLPAKHQWILILFFCIVR
ncbi:hypothetical protein EJA10_08800 [Mesobacillus subterraneus]|uniref:Uncharacterized protein n=1 Tax=Mesobacillus subterraneus TaxID=285983 RepID=A0A3R9F2X2_9BACI|nr:hypothetical protein EJA10_08800 [Mesobacillus subterraneus]